MQTYLAPLLTGGTDSIQSVVKVLGLPQENFAFNTDQARSVETYTLQRLAEGKQQYTGYTITTAMASSNAQIFEVFSFEQAQAIEFVHQYFDFEKELAVQTPAQSPPGYVEVKESSTKTTLNRYALGATTTVQELKTSKGQFIWRGKLIIVSIAFIETSELLVIQTLLTTPSLYAQYAAASGIHPLDLARAGRMKDVLWDILRTRENGFAELVDLMQQEFSSQNIFATHVILTEGMRSLIMASPMKKEYYRNGPGAAQNATLLGDAIGDTYAGVKLIIVRPIELRKKDLRIAPLERLAVTGQHWRLDHVHDDCDLSEWCSLWMAAAVFTMEYDIFEKIDIQSALEADHRFNRSDGKLANHHQTLADDPDVICSNRGVPVVVQDKIPQYDMFLYTQRNTDGKVVTKVASLWGHMENWALGYKAVDRTAETMKNLVTKVVSAGRLEAIVRGFEVIRDLYEREPNENDAVLLQTAAINHAVLIRAGGARPRYGVPLPPTTAQLNNPVVSPTVRTDYDTFVTRGRLRPYGYGSVAGLLTLSRVTDPAYDPDLIKVAVAFRDAIVPVHQLFVRIFGITHPALDPNNAPLAFRSNGTTSADRNVNSMLNLFSNVFDTNKGTLFLVRNNTSNAAETSTIVEFEPLDGSEFAGLNVTLEETGYPASLASAFGTPERFAVFQTKFKTSSLAHKLALLLKDRAAASTGNRRRRGRQAPTDGDAGDALLLDGDGTGSASFTQLYTLMLGELLPDVGAADYNQRIVAFLTRVVDSVLRDRIVDEEGENFLKLLKAWAGGPTGFTSDATAVVENAAQGRDLYYASPFVGSLQSVDSAENRRIFRLSSPFDPATPMNPDRASARDRAAADATGPNIDVLKMTMFSSVRYGGTRASLGYGIDLGGQANSPYAGIQMPTFGAAEFQDVVGDELVTNKNITERFMNWGGVTELLKRVCAQMLILAPITVHVLWAFKVMNIAQPVAWLVEQPFRRYTTTSAIFLSKPNNAPIGNVKWFDPDVHIGRNAINKNVMAHISMYLGVTVDDVHNWLVAYDIAVVKYRGGETTKPFTLHEWKQANINLLGFDGPSLFYFMVPADSLCGTNPYKTPFVHDIRGYSDAINYSGNSVHRHSKFAKRPYFSSAAYYTSLWSFDTKLHTMTREDWYSFHTYRDGTHNTVTAQGLQMVYDPVTKGFDRCIMPQDVFKTNVYPGCRELRDSLLPRIYKQDQGYEKRSITV